MGATKADIIARLQRDILPLQGFKPNARVSIDVGLGPLLSAFPNQTFPLGAVHEFLVRTSEDAAATAGFISALLSPIMRLGGAALWISTSPDIFPPGLTNFGIQPDKIIFIHLKTERDVLWACEEALKCNGLAAVISELNQLSFTASRRLQIAVEHSRVTAFIIRQPRNINTTASLTRWKVTSIASEVTDDMPGVGSSRWNVELLKVRNGKPGTWQFEWSAGRFNPISRIALLPEERKKTG